MSLDADLLTDRRRLKRRLGLWRVLGIAAIAVAVVLGVAIARGGDAGFGFRDHIARVTIDGIITDDRRQQELLDRIARADRAKALILRIDSPGGTTAGAEALYEAIREVAAEKPVVAVMGTVAASGGYIAALAADHIVARGNTITGSIGVVFQWAEFSELIERLGVSVGEVKSGPLKAEPSPFSKASPEAVRVTEQMVRDSYEWFVGLVADRRPLADAEARAVSDGRVYTGRQALAAKLVDAIGGEEAAVEWLATQGVDGDLKVVDWVPEQTSDWSVVELAVTRVLDAVGLDGVVQFVTMGQKALRAERLSLDGLVSVWQPDR